MKRRPYGGHLLAFGATYNPGDDARMTYAARTVKQTGGTLLELTCTNLLKMEPDEVAAAVRLGGIEEVSYCRFYTGGSDGDPIGDDPAGIDTAVTTFQQDVDYINRLRDGGLTVRFITGPNCFGLGVNYGQSRNVVRDRIRGFYDRVGKIIDGQGLTVAVEYLRGGEDEGAIGSAQELCHLLDLIANPNVGAHADTFHMRERGETPHKVIRLMDKRLKYLHAHGDKRSVPGTYDDNGFSDEIDWYLLGRALAAVGYEGPVVAEPFGEQTRIEIPPLGVGLPPAIDARVYYDGTLAHFERVGVLTY